MRPRVRALVAGLAAFALVTALPLAREATAASARLTADEAVSQGLRAAPGLEQARLAVEKARLGLKSAEAQRFDYSADLALGDQVGALGVLGTGPLTTGNLPTANGVLALRVPLFSGFRVGAQLDQAKAALDAAVAREDAARLGVVASLEDAYWQARRSELRVDVRREAAAQARRSRAVVAASFAIGRATAAELDRAEVSLETEESSLLGAEGDADLARDQLSSLLGRDLAGTQLVDPPARADAPVMTLAQALSLAFARRPDLREAAARLAVEQASLTVARADRWPQLAFVSAYQHGNNPYLPTTGAHSVLDTFAGTFNAGLNLNWNLFDNGKIGRAIQASDLDRAQAEQGLVAARRQIALEVRQAYHRLEVAQRRLAHGKNSARLAARNLAWLEGRFKFGYALLLEVNEARSSLVTARDRDVDAQIDREMAASGLRRACGTLLPPRPGPAALPDDPGAGSGPPRSPGEQASPPALPRHP